MVRGVKKVKLSDWCLQHAQLFISGNDDATARALLLPTQNNHLLIAAVIDTQREVNAICRQFRSSVCSMCGRSRRCQEKWFVCLWSNYMTPQAQARSFHHGWLCFETHNFPSTQQYPSRPKIMMLAATISLWKSLISLCTRLVMNRVFSLILLLSVVCLTLSSTAQKPRSLALQRSTCATCGENSMLCLHSNQYLEFHAWSQHTRTGIYIDWHRPLFHPTFKFPVNESQQCHDLLSFLVLAPRWFIFQHKITSPGVSPPLCPWVLVSLFLEEKCNQG